MNAIDHSRFAAALDADRLLRWAATFFAVAVLVHGIDHTRRGADSVEADVFWVGSAALLIEVGVVAIVFVRHRHAPLAALAVGSSLAIGYLVVHFTPRRSWLSDSFTSGAPAAVSVAAATTEVLAAVTLAAAGWYALRDRGGLASAAAGAGSDVDRAGLLHPVVVAMAIGNAAIFAVSVAGL